MELNGRVVDLMDAVTFGRPANEALLEETKNYDANRVFLLASGTLNRNTDEIDKIRRSLGNKCVGEFFYMSPYTAEGRHRGNKLAMEKSRPDRYIWWRVFNRCCQGYCALYFK